MTFDAKRASRMLGIMTFTFLFMFVISTQDVIAANMDANNTGLTVPDYIFECWDGSGYADYPGGASDLETTLKAVELLHEYEAQWHSGTWQQLDSLVEQYTAMQSEYRGGFAPDGKDSPDMQTTALVLESLSIMDRFGAINTEMAERYLWSSFRGSLTLKRWISDGDLTLKY